MENKVELAFELLKEELGKDFKYKDINSFKNDILSRSGLKKKIASDILEQIPNAVYVDFTVAYDNSDRREDVTMKIISDDGNITRPISLKNGLYHIMERFFIDLVEATNEYDLEPDQFLNRFILETMEIKDIEEDED